MADFQQRGPITTLHRLAAGTTTAIENELLAHASEFPVTLLIPCLATEMDKPALAGMVRELARAHFLDTVVVSLDRASEVDYTRAREYFSALHHRTVVLWNDSPQVSGLTADIERSVTRLPPRGKGRAVWMALGYIVAENRARAVALHDADVVDYQRTLLANLIAPIVHPSLRYEFAKAYYARYTDRLYGRVTRLLMRPLLQALGDVVGRHPYLSYLAAFRYPLSGELAFLSDLARLIRVPGDWGFEIGLLFEVLRHRSPRRLCQVDIADRFEHKHQELSASDPDRGLHRMAVDIVKHLLRTFSAAGVVLPESSFKSMRVAYQRYAEDAVSDSYADAVFNGLTFDRHAEEEAVDTFGQGLAEGCSQFLEDPLGTPSLPNWERVLSAIPDAGRRLLSAVKELGGVLAP